MKKWEKQGHNRILHTGEVWLTVKKWEKQGHNRILYTGEVWLTVWANLGGFSWQAFSPKECKVIGAGWKPTERKARRDALSKL